MKWRSPHSTKPDTVETRPAFSFHFSTSGNPAEVRGHTSKRKYELVCKNQVVLFQPLNTAAWGAVCLTGRKSTVTKTATLTLAYPTYLFLQNGNTG